MYTLRLTAKFVMKIEKEKGTAMLKLTWNRYAMLMAMKKLLLVNATFDIIDYSRQNVYALFIKLLPDIKKEKEGHDA